MEGRLNDENSVSVNDSVASAVCSLRVRVPYAHSAWTHFLTPAARVASAEVGDFMCESRFVYRLTSGRVARLRWGLYVETGLLVQNAD